MTEPTLTLRQVAKELATSKDKVGDDALLGLLRSEQLSAGFYLPGTQPEWVLIPASYWHKVQVAKFRAIRYSSRTKKPGTFRVRIGDFASTYVEKAMERLNNQPSGELGNLIEVELAEALATAAARHEVQVLETEWRRYSETKSQQSQQPNPLGRPQRPGWKELLPIVAGYFMALGMETERAQDAIARDILSRAQEENIKGLPVQETLRDALAQARAFAEEFARNRA